MPGRHWTDAETVLLKRLLRQTKTPSAVLLPGRSAHAIFRKAIRVGCWTPAGFWPSPWPAARVGRLRRLVAQGCGPTQIAEEGLLNEYSPTAIEKKLRRLGLKNPERHHRRKRNSRLTNRQRTAFHAFLHAHVHEWTPEQLALEWNRQFRPKVSRGKAVYHLTALGIKPPRLEVLRMPYSQEKMRRAQRTSVRVAEARTRRWNRYRLQLMARLRQRLRGEIQDARAYGTTAPRLWRCLDCGVAWPARAPYFPVQQTLQADGRVRRRVRPRCRLCQNTRRRAARRTGLTAPRWATAHS